VFLGQRAGLSPLWKCLRRKAFTSLREVMQMTLRYDYTPTPDQVATALPVFGIPIDELGADHLEGWGTGKEHLLRPDELVAAEAIRRELPLHQHLVEMLFYGRVDLNTGKNLVPSLEEMYMSDDEMPVEKARGIHGGCGNVPFADNEWTPKLARKARWEELTDQEREDIVADDRDEIARAQAWEDDSELDYEPEPDDFDLDTEHERVPMSSLPVSDDIIEQLDLDDLQLTEETGLDMTDSEDATMRYFTEQYCDSSTEADDGSSESKSRTRSSFGSTEESVDTAMDTIKEEEDDMIAQAYEEYTEEELEFDWTAYLEEMKAADGQTQHDTHSQKPGSGK